MKVVIAKKETVFNSASGKRLAARLAVAPMSRAMDRRIAEKLRANPALMNLVRTQLAHELTVHQDNVCRQVPVSQKGADGMTLAKLLLSA